MTDHPLRKLEGLPLGTCSLRLSRIEPMRMSGWRRFSVHLVDPSGELSESPVLDGIFSVGGKGVQPWVEIAAYHTVHPFGRGHRIDLGESDLESTLFRYIHDILQPGSHIMLWYEGESGRETDLALTRGIPPILTPMGSALFSAGFYSLRNFHLPEGGHEGGRKLWGERPFNEEVEREQKRTALEESLDYFIRPIRPGLVDIEIGARSRLIGILEKVEPALGEPRSIEELRGAVDLLRNGSIPVEKWPVSAAESVDRFISPTRTPSD